MNVQAIYELVLDGDYQAVEEEFKNNLIEVREIVEARKPVIKETLLFHAGNVETAAVLLQYGANIEAMSLMGRTPLDYAIQDQKIDVKFIV